MMIYITAAGMCQLQSTEYGVRTPGLQESKCKKKNRILLTEYSSWSPGILASWTPELRISITGLCTPGSDKIRVEVILLSGNRYVQAALIFLAAVVMYIAFCPSPALAGDDQVSLIVVGSEPEAVTTAVSAARNGVQTMLIAEDPVLGGLMTRGCLNFLDMNYGPDKELLTRGLFLEFYESLGNAFDIEAAQNYFLEIVQKEPNIVLKLNTPFLRPLMEGNKIVGVVVQENGMEKEYRAERVIDATADADVAAAAGVPYTLGTEDYGVTGRTMGATLVFRVKGVNWPYVFFYNNFQRLLSKLNPKWGDPAAGATWKVAWGYGREALEYTPQDPLMRYRGPNLARQKDGTVLINALLIFGVDGLDPESRAQGIERGKQEIPHILQFMRERFPGFRRVELVDVAEELYIRETRHIIGEYRLTIDDVLENRDHWDRIAHGSYPVDIQPAGPQDLGNVIGKPAIYSIPYRSMVPLKVDNLLVVTRSASYDSLPHGSTRVLPVGMTVGEAAGVATAYSLGNNLSYREMIGRPQAIRWVQEKLQSQGAYLVQYDPPRPAVMDHWAYPGVKVMRRLGLAAGGYANDYHLEQAIMYWDADYLVKETWQRIHYFRPEVSLAEVAFPQNITRRDLYLGLGEGLTGRQLSFAESVDLIRSKVSFPAELEGALDNPESQPTFAEIYCILGRIFESFVNDQS